MGYTASKHAKYEKLKQFWPENLTRKNDSKDLIVDERIILKWMLKYV